MTRREFFALLAAAGAPRRPVVVPVRLIIDGHANLSPAQLRRFWSFLWPQAAQNFESGGIHLETTAVLGEVKRSPGGLPIFEGLDRSVLNLVITDQIAIQWDRARALSGVTTRYQGYYLCMVALNWAHPHQIPFLSVNTCVHELLHALLQDIFEDRPSGLKGATREIRVDWYATRLWLFHEGTHIRETAQRYVERLRQDVASRK